MRISNSILQNPLRVYAQQPTIVTLQSDQQFRNACGAHIQTDIHF